LAFTVPIRRTILAALNIDSSTLTTGVPSGTGTFRAWWAMDARTALIRSRASSSLARSMA
jgi:hypothetical protein